MEGLLKSWIIRDNWGNSRLITMLRDEEVLHIAQLQQLDPLGPNCLKQARVYRLVLRGPGDSDQNRLRLQPDLRNHIREPH